MGGHTSYWFDDKQCYPFWKSKGHDPNCSDTFVFWGCFQLLSYVTNDVLLLFPPVWSSQMIQLHMGTIWKVFSPIYLYIYGFWKSAHLIILSNVFQSFIRETSHASMDYTFSNNFTQVLKF